MDDDRLQSLHNSERPFTAAREVDDDVGCIHQLTAKAQGCAMGIRIGLWKSHGRKRLRLNQPKFADAATQNLNVKTVLVGQAATSVHLLPLPDQLLDPLAATT